ARAAVLLGRSALRPRWRARAPTRAPASALRARWYGRRRQRCGSRGLLPLCKRDLHGDARAPPRLAFDAKLAAQKINALAQTHKAESIRPAGIVEIEAATVVADVQRHRAVGVPKRDL